MSQQTLEFLTYPSNQAIKSQLVNMYAKFVLEVDPNGILMDHLFQHKVINIEQKEEIKNKTRMDGCRTLLDKLFSSTNPIAFQVLLQALKKHYHWMADDIERIINDESVEAETLKHSSQAKDQQLKNFETELKDLKIQLLKSKENEQKLQNEFNISDSELIRLRTETVALRSTVSDLETKETVLVKQLQTTTSCLQISDDKLQELRNELDNEKLKTASSSNSTTPQVKLLQLKLTDSQSKEQKMSDDLNIYKVKVDRLEKEKEKLSEKVRDLTASEQQLRTELEETRTKRQLDETTPISHSSSRQSLKLEVKAVYGYTGQGDDELTLTAGDVISDVIKSDTGWWEGTLLLKRGTFPSNYVQELVTSNDIEKTVKPPVAARRRPAVPQPPPVSSRYVNLEELMYDEIRDEDVDGGLYVEPVPLRSLSSSTLTRAVSAISYKQKPDLHGVIPGTIRVSGVATLANQLFVVRDQSKNIEIFDLNNLLRQAKVVVLKLVSKRLGLLTKKTLSHSPNPVDIASCDCTNCLYISDYANCRIHRVDQKGEMINSWDIDGQPSGLSVSTISHNVLVCCPGPSRHRFMEFTCDGTLVATRQLPQDMVRPWRAVEVGSMRWMICHGGQYMVDGTVKDHPLHRVCLVSVTDVSNSQTKIVASHGAASGSSPDQLASPLHVTVDAAGSILVVDFRNDRIKLLDPSLRFVRDLVGTGNGLKAPRRLHLCRTSGQLYVGLSDGRVLIYQVTEKK